MLNNGPWLLSDLKNVTKNGLKVVSAFSCGGGSTMGYKLAGFDVVGSIEIDKDMSEIYVENHKPKWLFNMSIQEFNRLPDPPKEFFDIDILDGSPPCSSFSMAGHREKKWGKASHFREGQASQHLDDLFFDFIATAKRLQPKVIVAENVKGLIQGNAKGYVKQIFHGFKEAGYSVQLFLMNASRMGVPQVRNRTFFIANRLGKTINMEFNEDVIPLGVALQGCSIAGAKPLTESTKKLWHQCKVGKGLNSVHAKGGRWNWHKASKDLPSSTICATDCHMHLHWAEPRSFSDSELCRIQTFPDDYNFLNQSAGYVCGMSVPPYMMQRIANQIHIQFFGG